MAKSNFKVFAESVTDDNVMTDASYETDTQRVSGVVPGIADPLLHNKLYKQSTIMSAALAQVVTQAGYDAMDNDYTGLVSNIRHSFVGSVNNIKPDANGNVDISSLLTALKNWAIPDVGELKITKNPDNPAKKYPGTTWELVEEGTFIMAAGKTETVNSTGGSNSHTPQASELVPHTHVASASYSGAHNHTGTTSTNGAHHHGDGYGGENYENHAPFGFYDGNGNRYGTNGSDWDNRLYNTSTDGAHNHTFTTTTASAHTHDIIVQSAGEGKPYDSRPKYRAFYIWIRTA